MLNDTNTKLGCSENLYEGSQRKHGIKNILCGSVTKGNLSQTAALL